MSVEDVLSDDYDDELHKAWVKHAMSLSHQVALAYSDMSICDEEDGLFKWQEARKILKEHLLNQPASMALTDPELRAGMTLQRREIDRLRNDLEYAKEELERLNNRIVALEAQLSAPSPS